MDRIRFEYGDSIFILYGNLMRRTATFMRVHIRHGRTVILV